MSEALAAKEEVRRKRALRVRKGVRGTAQKPRLSVVKTNRNVIAQVIDDESGKTLAFASTMSKKGSIGKSKEAASQIGGRIAARLNELNVDQLVFDRGQFKFHGILAALADAVRQAGVKV